MNDELSGQLTDADYLLPDYAQNSLWLQTETDSVQLEGENGLFELSTPAQHLYLRWGYAEGPVLARLRWQADSLEWDGRVRIGGAVESLHLSEVADTELVIATLYTIGQPLMPTAQPYATTAERKHSTYQAPAFLDDVDTDAPDSFTTWLVAEDSPLLTMAQDAMMNKHRIWLHGKLADEGSGWDTLFALPLLLDGLTLFAL